MPIAIVTPTDRSLTPPDFPVLDAVPTDEEAAALSPFTVSLVTGFLPVTAPPVVLPAAFAAVSSLLERMPVLIPAAEGSGKDSL